MSTRSALIHGLPCLACKKQGVKQLLRTEEHHLLSGNRRRGDAFSVPLCGWHHRGEPPEGFGATSMTYCAGPSLQRASKRFHREYGTDEEMLAQTNRLLGLEVAA